MALALADHFYEMSNDVRLPRWMRRVADRIGLALLYIGGVRFAREDRTLFRG
jgi:hypothetical protein